jgi:hypothetical protein
VPDSLWRFRPRGVVEGYRVVKGIVVRAQGGILGRQWVHLVEARQHGVVGAEGGLPPAGGRTNPLARSPQTASFQNQIVMAYSIVLEPLSLQDIQQGFDYYDDQQIGLGEKFEAAVNKHLISLGKILFFRFAMIMFTAYLSKSILT